MAASDNKAHTGRKDRETLTGMTRQMAFKEDNGLGLKLKQQTQPIINFPTGIGCNLL